MSKTPDTSTPEDDQEDPCKSCFWKRLEILGRPLAATLTTIAIALFGYYGQQTITQITEAQNDTRLYTELMSRREEAESALRKDMFNATLKDFFTPPKTDMAHAHIEHRLLKLELLALNFGESLSLNPLFLELDKAIRLAGNYRSLPALEVSAYQKAHQRRLQRLAKLVAGRQVAAILPRGVSVLIEFNTASIGEQGYQWPYNESALENPELEPAMIEALAESKNCFTVDGIGRKISLVFSRPSAKFQTLKVSLGVSTRRWNPDHPELAAQNPCDATEAQLDAGLVKVETNQPISFTLDYYNFPLIDHTLLTDDQRLAVVLQDFNTQTNQVKVRAIVYPGKYSSRRDKPALNEAIEQLRRDVEINRP
jgi:hypothetical protein